MARLAAALDVFGGFGIDKNHPTPGSRQRPHVAAAETVKNLGFISQRIKMPVFLSCGSPQKRSWGSPAVFRGGKTHSNLSGLRHLQWTGYLFRKRNKDFSRARVNSFRRSQCNVLSSRPNCVIVPTTQRSSNLGQCWWRLRNPRARCSKVRFKPRLIQSAALDDRVFVRTVNGVTDYVRRRGTTSAVSEAIQKQRLHQIALARNSK